MRPGLAEAMPVLESTNGKALVAAKQERLSQEVLVYGRSLEPPKTAGNQAEAMRQ